MKTSYVIKKAIISEKATNLMNLGIYTFLVDPRANKKDIAKEVEKQFSVNVQKVNITKFAPKAKRIAQSRKMTTVGGGKKAIVVLKAGQTISLLAPKTEAKKAKEKKENDNEKNSKNENKKKDKK